MNFLREQERARKQTKKLIVLFILNAFLISGLTAFVAAGFFNRTPGTSTTDLWDFWLNSQQTYIFFSVFGFVILLVALTSLYKVFSIRSAAHYTMIRLGGVIINPGDSKYFLKRFYNVVEEMAIASGVPVPGVYYIPDEEAINAFAAGEEVNNAIICATEGALKKLTRSELQAVVAHEFSHIFWGDMKLNIRLVGILHGLFFISLIGNKLLRSTGRRRATKDSGAPILLLGFAFVIIGWLGSVLGKMITASISREREYLADASAVRFTRNPESVMGALKKILASFSGSQLNSSAAKEFSHFFFAEGVGNLLFATHPPLGDRIRKIDPRFNEKVFKNLEKEKLQKSMQSIDNEIIDRHRSRRAKDFKFWQIQDPYINIHENKNVKPIDMATVLAVSEWLSGLPEKMQEAKKVPDKSILVIYSYFFFQSKVSPFEQEFSFLKSDPDRQECVTFVENFQKTPHHLSHSLLETYIPNLKNFADSKKKEILKNILKIIRFDKKTMLKEFCSYYLLKTELYPSNKIIEEEYSLKGSKKEVSYLISIFHQLNNTDKEQLQENYKWSKKAFSLTEPLVELGSINLKLLGKYLDHLQHLRPLEKEKLFEHLVEISKLDSFIKEEEFDFLKLLNKIFLIPTPLNLKIDQTNKKDLF